MQNLARSSVALLSLLLFSGACNDPQPTEPVTVAGPFAPTLQAVTSSATGPSITTLASGGPFVNSGAVTVSPNGGIVYVGDWGASSIFTVPPTGGSPQLLGRVPSGFRGIAASPDGTTLFVAGWGRGSIFSVSTSTGATTFLASGSPFVRPHGVTVSPDGATLFIVDNFGGTVFSLPASGGSSPILLGSSFGEPLDVAVSPDGSTLFFTDARPPTIYSMPSSGGVPSIVTSGAPLVRPTGISISPDGAFLYVVDDAGVIGQPPAVIYRVPVLGGGPAAVYTGLPLLSPAFAEVSPDGLSLFIADAGHFGPGAVYRLAVAIEVLVDIKPGSDPNSINCDAEKKTIAVAILTTDDFDATTVDHTTVTFEAASETHVNKKTDVARRHEEDVDGDGDTDLVLHFRLGETDLTCDSTEGTLIGETFDGQSIEGTDAVRMID